MYRWVNENRTHIFDLDNPGRCIPAAPSNPDYQKVQAWVQAGNVIQEPEAPPPEPKSDIEIMADQVDALVKASGAQPTPEFQAVRDRMAAKRAKRV